MARVSTPKPGQIRCPTCHESTPPGAFCTRCGQPIPASALARPRGLDRQELEDRLRGRRAGDTPYRRGSPADEGAAGGSAFDRFEPEPEDALAKRDLPPGASAAPRVDNFSAAGEAAAAASGARPAREMPPAPPRRAGRARLRSTPDRRRSRPRAIRRPTSMRRMPSLVHRRRFRRSPTRGSVGIVRTRARRPVRRRTTRPGPPTMTGTPRLFTRPATKRMTPTTTTAATMATTLPRRTTPRSAARAGRG